MEVVKQITQEQLETITKRLAEEKELVMKGKVIIARKEVV
jgi:hypothetical protein